MNTFLMKEYNKDLKGSDIKREREASKETIDGHIPGIMKATVRRIAENKEVKGLLG
jgi:hypothetical protein